MRNSLRSARTVIGALVLGLAACQDDSVSSRAVDRVVVGDPIEIELGAEQQLTATAYDARGGVVDGRAVSWDSRAPAIVTVTSSGLVRGIAPGGPVQVTATVGGRSASKLVTVLGSPVLAVSRDSIALAYGGTLTDSLRITNAGTGLLNGLTVGTITYSGTASGWISGAWVNTTFAPSTLTVAAVPWAVEAGDHLARITVLSTRSGHLDSSVIKVSLSIRRLALQALRVGFDQSCGLVASGMVCWGITAPPPPSAPAGPAVSASVPVVLSSGLPFVQMAVGQYHRCGRTQPGEVYCWGGNNFGQVGDGTTSTVNAPTRIGGSLLFRDIAAGAGYTCGVTVANVGYCWGSQVGDGTESMRNVPTPIAGGLAFTSVSGSSNHACGLTTAGEVYCWGRNEFGEFGDGTITSSPAPVRAATAIQFTEMAVGVSHTCAIATSGTTYCWGLGTSGQLGTGGIVNQRLPVAVQSPVTFVKLAIGRNHSCGLTADGLAYCWGLNSSQQLGVLTNGGIALSPSQVLQLPPLLEISAGTTHTCGRSAQATYCWGGNTLNQLGDGTVDSRLKPTPVAPLLTPP